MAFRKSIKNVYVSPGTIGDAIRRCRELRNLSMQELGLKCGFPAASADIRIAQYESNKRVPSEETLKNIADALEVDVETFLNIGMMTDKRMLKILFEIENQRGLHPHVENGAYGLRFDNTRFTDDYIKILIGHWYKKYKECEVFIDDSEDEKRRKKAEYETWKAEFPQQIELEEIERSHRAWEKQNLQDKLDMMNEEDHAEEKMRDLKKVSETMKKQVLSSYEPIKKLSDLVNLMIDVMVKGLPIERNLDGVSIYNSLLINDSPILFIIKYADIMGGEVQKELYAKVNCAIETIRENGMTIKEQIVCRNNDFYIIYRYDFKDKLDISLDTWEGIKRVVEDEKSKFYEEKVYARDRKRFINGIPENDIQFK